MSISLKLNVTADSMQSAVSLCTIVRNKIEEMYVVSKEIIAIEIELFENLRDCMKGARLLISTPELAWEETALSKNWEDAFEKAHEKVSGLLFEKFGQVNVV